MLDPQNLCQKQQQQKSYTVWKVSKYGVISGPHFPVFSPNTEIYGLEITPYLETFHTVLMLRKSQYCHLHHYLFPVFFLFIIIVNILTLHIRGWHYMHNQVIVAKVGIDSKFGVAFNTNTEYGDTSQYCLLMQEDKHT